MKNFVKQINKYWKNNIKIYKLQIIVIQTMMELIVMKIIPLINKIRQKAAKIFYFLVTVMINLVVVVAKTCQIIIK